MGVHSIFQVAATSGDLFSHPPSDFPVLSNYSPSSSSSSFSPLSAATATAATTATTASQLSTAHPSSFLLPAAAGPPTSSKMGALALDQEEWVAPGPGPNSLVGPRSRSGKPTSFSLYLPDLLSKLKSARDGLEEVDDKLQQYILKIPEAVSQVKDNYATKTTDVAKTLKETLETSRLVRDKIRSFNDRVDDALKDALKFNLLVKEQHEVPNNKLPDEMFEGAGAVVAQLSRSHNLGHQLLMKDAERLVRLAKQTKLRYASASPALLGALALATEEEEKKETKKKQEREEEMEEEEEEEEEEAVAEEALRWERRRATYKSFL